MTHTEWMIEAERLLNVMEQLDYKSPTYLQYRAKLKEHMASKPDMVDEDTDSHEPDVWTMTGPGRLERM